MFCRNCGTQMDEGVKFCPNCGTPTEGPMGNAGQGTAPAAPPTGKKKPPYVAIGAIVVAVVLIVVAIFGVRAFMRQDSGKEISSESVEKADSSEALIGKMVEGIMERDVEKIMSLYPEVVLEAIQEAEGLDSREELVDEIMSSIGDSDEWEDYDKIEYEIIDEENIPEADIEELRETMEDNDFEMNLQAAKWITCDITFIKDGKVDEENSGEISFPIIKVDGEWYLWTAAL